MGVKIFSEKSKKLKLISDKRDIAVDWNNRQAVWDWCKQNEIQVEYQGTSPWANLFEVDLWRIKNEQHRVLFALRWA